MTKNLKISLALVVGAVVVVFIAANAGGGGEAEVVSDSERSERLVRSADSQLLSEADSDVQFVEFLDFECESCRAAFPAVEQLRKDYAGKVTFVVRYFPLPGHFNAERAAARRRGGRPARQVRADVPEDVRDPSRMGRAAGTRRTTGSAASPRSSASIWPPGTRSTTTRPRSSGSNAMSPTAKPSA